MGLSREAFNKTVQGLFLGTVFNMWGCAWLVPQDEQHELAKTIRVSGSILLSTVSNFLDFFKMEAGKQLDVVRTETDVQVIRYAF